MIAAGMVAEALGGKKILHRTIESESDLLDSVEHGLPKATVRHIFRIFGGDRAKYIYLFIPEGTYKKRKDTLNLEESQKAERIARLIATAQYVWDDENDVRQFLITPHPYFRNRKPLEVAFTELGARHVEELLWKIYYGLPV